MDPEAILAQASSKLPDGDWLKRNVCLKRIRALQAVHASDTKLLAAFLDDVIQNPEQYVEKSIGSQRGADEPKSSAPQLADKFNIGNRPRKEPALLCSSAPQSVEEDEAMLLERVAQRILIREHQRRQATEFSDQAQPSAKGGVSGFIRKLFKRRK